MWKRAGDPRVSLTRQSLLVAMACLFTDVFVYLFKAPMPMTGTAVLGLLAIVVVDAALAGPARLSGVVAVGHALVRVGIPLLLDRPLKFCANEAGMMIAGYRAGAWLVGVPAFAALGALSAGMVAAHFALSTGEVRLVNDLRLLPVEVVSGAVLPWLVGRYTTARRAYIAELDQRSELERRDAEEGLAKAIAAERSAIARDLHDVIAHHVSAINLHAGAARLGLDQGKTPLAASLSAVETASRAAMVDLRHLLDLLHGDNSDSARQPGLDNLDELFEGVRSAGIPARLTTSGAPRELPESLGITLYRIVQEMLTNALRHGDPSGVDVELAFRHDSLALSTTNRVPALVGARAEGHRRGLEGIRNRARLFDGVTTCGLEPDGRTWRTAVAFPLEPSPPC
ncbi:sensor histidine kinase [Umezawaea endophytica]|uniref:histidine kinase n=1 Tax=Umezawaea endophytica TaxID=1654476 RepID=A0A9X2VMK5_9PSEU|nr:histidine kinase [Umezawaea endophytica]MCS7479276.1 histidine kinase [Umezawaea endophytica]